VAKKRIEGERRLRRAPLSSKEKKEEMKRREGGKGGRSQDRPLGPASSNIRQEQLFYLRSRGLFRGGKKRKKRDGGIGPWSRTADGILPSI